MKTKLYLLLTLFVTCQQTYAQCGQRYKEKVFADVTIISDIVYTTANNTTLKLDVYEPTGDTQSLRPLIIMAHGGSFVLGNKTMDSVVTRYCNSFAKRGYVCASIDYRLGSPLQLLDTVSLMNVVTKCIGDGKAAIRFFRKDAATTNTWRINPNMIIVGGNSAGAVLYMQAVYIDSVNEAPPTYRDAMIQNGGLEGNSGNDGYSSQAQALINLAGGLNVPEFVGPNSIPSFNAQGDADVTIAYNCGFAENGLVPVRLCGLGAIEPLYQQYNI
ncbi:MAG TPA: alpha/beta hydrolase, partial [Chitinophagales bacterium]|nr:alpha/beta hydrolase [Chitinophagales bacterium]